MQPSWGIDCSCQLSAATEFCSFSKKKTRWRDTGFHNLYLYGGLYWNVNHDLSTLNWANWHRAEVLERSLLGTLSSRKRYIISCRKWSAELHQISEAEAWYDESAYPGTIDVGLRTNRNCSSAPPLTQKPITRCVRARRYVIHDSGVFEYKR